MKVNVLAEDGSPAGEAVLADEIFAAKVNVPLMHQAVTAQLAAARAGTHSTKTRGEVRGGGKKPWRQKGTGRARHGSIREPQWVGGGRAFGPKPRDHTPRLPKKMKALALRSALTARAQEGKILVVQLDLDAPKTRRALKALEAWGVAGKCLVVLDGPSTTVARSFRNIPKVHLLVQEQLNPYDVLNADTIIFLREALDVFQVRAQTLTGRRRSLAAAPAAAEPAPVVAGAREDAAASPEAASPEAPRPADSEVTPDA